MKSKFLILFSFFIFLYANLQAGDGSETKSLTGKVTDIKSGETLAGALISVVGTDIKAYSDFDGNFLIENISEGPVEIKVSLVSYKEYIIKNPVQPSSDDELNIRLIAF